MWTETELTALRSKYALAARYNIAPTQEVPCIFSGGDSKRWRFDLFRWGLLPFWAKDLASGARAINARSETAHEKTMFKQAFAKRRCVVPADGYFEWAKTSQGKQPYYVRRKDERMLAMAGLWEENDRLGTGGKPILSFTILTTQANEVTGVVHDRMPVFLTQEQTSVWLDPGIDDAHSLRSMIGSAPADWFELFPVSSIVNSAKNDSAECTKPIELLRQQSLFD